MRAARRLLLAALRAAAPARTPGRSPASRTAGPPPSRRGSAAGSCRRARTSRRGRRRRGPDGRRRPPRPPRACTRPRTPRGAGRAPARGARAARGSSRSSPAASAGGRAGRAARSRKSRLRSRRSASAAGESSFTRAAASSIASGSPSSRAHIAATAAAFSAVSAKPGHDRSRARSTKSATAGEPRELLERRQVRGIRHGERRHGHLALAVQAQGGLAGDEHLEAPGSGEQGRDLGRGGDDALEAVQHQQGVRPQRPRERLGQRPGAFRAGGGAQREAARDLGHDPRRVLEPRERDEGDSPAKSARTSSATRIARRVLPVPPGPVSVTSLTSRLRSSSRIAARSPSRPTSDVRVEGSGLKLVATLGPRGATSGSSQAREVVRQLARRGVAVGRVLARQRLISHCNGGGSEPTSRAGRRIAEDGGDRLGRGGLLERAAAGRHLEEHDPERELVAPVVHLPALRLLRATCRTTVPSTDAVRGERDGGWLLVAAPRASGARSGPGRSRGPSRVLPSSRRRSRA